ARNRSSRRRPRPRRPHARRALELPQGERMSALRARATLVRRPSSANPARRRNAAAHTIATTHARARLQAPHRSDVGGRLPSTPLRSTPGAPLQRWAPPKPDSSFSIAWSIVNEAGRCRGGKSLNVSRNFPTSPCAAVIRYAFLRYQSQYVFEVVSARSKGSVLRLKSLGILSGT